MCIGVKQREFRLRGEEKQESALNKDDSFLIAFEAANYIRGCWKFTQRCWNGITSVCGYAIRCRYDRNRADVMLTAESQREGDLNNLSFKARDPLIAHFFMHFKSESYFPMGRWNWGDPDTSAQEITWSPSKSGYLTFQMRDKKRIRPLIRSVTLFPITCCYYYQKNLCVADGMS